MRAVPGRTAVPEGEERVASLETALFTTGKGEEAGVVDVRIAFHCR